MDSAPQEPTPSEPTPDHSAHMALWIVGGSLYSLLLLFLLMSLRRIYTAAAQVQITYAPLLQKDQADATFARHKMFTIASAFTVAVLLAILAILRMAVYWMRVADPNGSADTSFVLRRMALLSFEIGYHVWILNWVVEHFYFLQRSRVVRNMLLCLVAIHILLTSIAVGFRVVKGESSIDRWTIIGVCIYNLVLVLAVLVWLNRRRANRVAPRQAAYRRFMMTYLSGVVLTLLLIARLVCYLWYPISGQYMPEVTFQLVVYFVPEALLIIVLTLQLSSSR
eukprot:TRINITY_DN4220_c0_g1_i1.p1 TRINITY_DN4220_c0_g1~~TRINITY_DN4220_c0_g1_i1.p1  ORF type:complete len:280 (-),score=9.87 TRINITY_DN4220_c0_g1_i1:214-1053(-)